MKGSLKSTTGNLLTPLGARNKDIGTVSQMLLTEGKLSLRRRLIVCGIPDSLSSIPESKAQDSGIHKQRFLKFPYMGRILNLLTASYDTTGFK